MEEAFYEWKESCKKADTFELFGAETVSDTPDFQFNFDEDSIIDALKKFYVLEKEAIAAEDSDDLLILKKCMTKVKALDEQKQRCSDTLNELQEKYKAVTDKTSSLHHACEQMMSQQTQMATGTEQLKTNLHYYTQCEWIMKKLQTSRLLITGSLFPQILSTIHECMNFLRANPEHRESAAYLEKYEQCLSKALTSIKTGVIADISACENEVLSRQATGKPTTSAFADDDTFALLYGVFGVKAAAVRNALALAHQYFSEHEEYQEMVKECEQEYFRIREQLLRSAVEKSVQSLIAKHKDSSCTLTRDGCSVLLRLCDDEFRLYKQFFIVDGTNPGTSTASSAIYRSRSPPTSPIFQHFWNQNSQSFNEFIESMCRILYDTLRPLIIHNPHLETLAQLCALLKIEMIEERCGTLTSMVHEDSFNPREGFVNVMNELVGDIVERIVYRTSSFGQTDIVGYKPAPGDLAYPERLLMMKNIEAETTPTPKTPTSFESANKKSTSAIDLHCLWYPTVRRTIVCLSKLYKCLDQSVFLSVSRELLDQCCQSLEFAADKMRALPIDPSKASVKGFGRQLDAELFIVKHLLIIREQTSPYRVTAKNLRNLQPQPGQKLDNDSAMANFDYSIDFSKYKNSALDLFNAENRSKWFELSTNNAFLSFLLAAPVQIHELQTDSRRIIEIQLKKHCHKLIKFVTNMVTGNLAMISSEIDMVETSEKPTEAWKANSKLSPKSLNDVISNAFKNMKQNWPAIRATFTLYIGVRETEEILLQPIRKSVVDTFTNINLFVQKHFSEEQRQIASVPNQEQIWLLLNA
uniref:Conserved oligomeric Golgi complex subunit 3 n=1 Tax=Panagrolaimus sp. PS1159 TaxID=55785 RepID=A0AC35FQN4_9BILA